MTPDTNTIDKLTATLAVARKAVAQMAAKRDASAVKLADAKAAAFADGADTKKARDAYETARKDLEFCTAMLAESQREADQVQLALDAANRAVKLARFEECARKSCLDVAALDALAARAVAAAQALEAIDRDARAMLDAARAAAAEATELRAQLGVEVPEGVATHVHSGDYVEILPSTDLQYLRSSIRQRVFEERNAAGNATKRLGAWIDPNG